MRTRHYTHFLEYCAWCEDCPWQMVGLLNKRVAYKWCLYHQRMTQAEAAMQRDHDLHLNAETGYSQ